MNLLALALCLIAQASFHPFFFSFFSLSCWTYQGFLYIFIYLISISSSIVVHPSIYILSNFPLCIFSSYRSPSSLNIGVPCYSEPIIDRAYRSLAPSYAT
jgi:hypothetical protein